MTIFVEIIKPFFINAIDKMIKISNEKDEQLGLSRLRNMELSKAKRDLLNELKNQVAIVTSVNDETIYVELQKLITGWHQNIQKERDSHLRRRGETEEMMDKWSKLMEEIYKKLQELEVLDTLHDKDPLNTFSYFLALYSAMQLEKNANPTLIESLTKNPLISSALQLEIQQARLVLQKHKKCIEMLSRIEKNKDYESEKSVQIIQFITAFQRENLQAQRSYPIYDPGIALSWHRFFAPSDFTTIPQSSDLLGRCLVDAYNEIQTNLISNKYPDNDFIEKAYEEENTLG